MSEHKFRKLANQQAVQDADAAEKERKRCCLRCTLFVGDPVNFTGGSCHYNPPAVFPIEGPKGMAFANAWPPVHATKDWCGHFAEQTIRIVTSIPSPAER